jgi:hypothetical protein
MVSLKVTVTALVSGTPVAPADGDVAVTVGAVMSKSAAAALRSGSGPMWPADAAACGVPVATSLLRTTCGLGAAPWLA